MADPYKYRAFISYSHRDRAWGEWLHKALESYRIPKQLIGTAGRHGPIPQRLFPIFRDRDETPASADLQDTIRRALQQSENLIVLCSPASRASRWVGEEILSFKRLGREARVFAFIVEGEPNSGGPGECFPEPLLYKLGPGGELGGERLEPAAADARPQGDGRDNAKLKLIAGLLGTDYDALKQRDLEQARKRTRIYRAIAASMAILAVLAIVGGGFAWHYALVSQEATRRAVIEARTAERTSDFLVSLFAIADPEQNRGNTVTAREMLDRGVAEVQSGLKDEDLVRGNLLRAMGQAYGGLGLYAKGRGALLAAANAARKSGNAEAILNSELALAANFYMDGNNEAALRIFRTALDRAEKLHGTDHPSVSEALVGLGDSLAGLSRDQEAERSYRRALAIDLKLHGEKNAATARSLNALATQLYAESRYDEARPLFQRALAVRKAVLGPRDANVAISLNNLGAIEYQTGHYEAAEKTYGEALPVYRAVYGDAHPQIAVALNNLGRSQLMRSNLEAAQKTMGEALALDRRFLSSGDDALVFPLNSLGMLALARGNTAAARGYLNEALAIAEAKKSPILDQVLGNCADLYARQKQTPEADEALARAHQIQSAKYGDALRGREAWRPAVLDTIDASIRISRGQTAQSRTLLLNALPVLEARFGTSGFYTQQALGLLVEAYRGEPAQAARYRRQLVARQ